MNKKEQLKAALAEFEALKSKSESLEAKGETLSDEDVAKAADLKKEIDGLKEAIKKSDEVQAAFKSMTIGDTTEKHGSPADSDSMKHYGSLGERFVKSEAYKSYRSDPSLPLNIRVEGVKADPAPINSTIPGAVVPQVQPGYTDVTYRQPNTFMSLISMGTTNAPFIQYRQLTSVTNNSSVVPEGGQKPKSTLTTALLDAHAFLVADGVDVTNQEIEDDGIMAALINNTLTSNIAQRRELLALNGSGTNDEPTGILNMQSVDTTPFDTDMFTTVSHAITDLRIAVPGITVQAILLNPKDDEKLNLVKDNEGRFLSNAPFATGPFTLFGIPRITSANIPEGTALIGDFKSIQWLNYKPLSILAFDQNKDNAEHNMKYVRAEERAMFLVREPKKIAKVSLAAPSGQSAKSSK